MTKSVAVETTMKVCELADAPSAPEDGANGPETPGAGTPSTVEDEDCGGGKEGAAEGSGHQLCHSSVKDKLTVKDGGEEDLGSINMVEMLSRDSSKDYTDSTGINLHMFLVSTLQNNPRDRMMLLKLEQNVLDFISNNESQRKFPPMTSYHRMLLHRVAAYFGMDHNVDPSGKSVVVSKTANTRIPHQKFSEHIKGDGADAFQKRYILKRDNCSFDHQDGTIRMRLKAGRKSKSMDEREVEYQQARERIFSAEEDHSVLDPRSQDTETRMSTQQRRHVFRQRSGHSGASWQSSSETEAARGSEHRAWSSTDSSDSSHRPPPAQPAQDTVGKASSFSGVCPGMARGDSTASSKSTGRLSETGSESSSSSSSSNSSSSAFSSSSSLPRPQLPLLAPAPLGAHRASTGVSHRAANASGPSPLAGVKSEPAETTLQSFYVLPLETAAAIMPGSVLLNAQTGRPLLSPVACAMPAPSSDPKRSTQHGKPPGQPPGQPIHVVAQQHPANHLHAQPSALNAHFSHMTLVRQPPDGGTGGARSNQDAHHCAAVSQHPYHPYHHQPQPSSMLPQENPAHPVGYYVVAGPPGVHPGVLHAPAPPQAPASAFSPLHPGNTAGPGAFPAASMMSGYQAFLQQQNYSQPAGQQVNSCYCAPTHYSRCAHQQTQYRYPVSPLSYTCPQGQSLPQHQAYHSAMPSPAPGYQTAVGMQPINSHALGGSQQSIMGNQMQGLMVHYPPMPAYQVSVPHGTPPVPQQTYQQPVMVSCQLPQGGSCYSLLPPSQHTTMSSTVSFLPVQVVEPTQYPQPSAACVSQQPLGQQCTGFYPVTPATGMVLMQLSAPPHLQPRSPCQRKPPSRKYPGPEQQRPHRPTEVLMPLDSSQRSDEVEASMEDREGEAERSSTGSQRSDEVEASMEDREAGGESGWQSSVRPASRTSTSALSASVHPPGGPPLALSTMPFIAHHHPHTNQYPPHTTFCPSGQGEERCPLPAQPGHCKPQLRPQLLQTAPVVTNHQKGSNPQHSPHPPSIPQEDSWERTANGKALATDLSASEPGPLPPPIIGS